MLDDNHLTRDAQTIQRNIDKAVGTRITVEEVERYLKVARQTAYERLQKWERLGITRYEPTSATRGNWYWIGVKK